MAATNALVWPNVFADNRPHCTTAQLSTIIDIPRVISFGKVQKIFASAIIPGGIGYRTFRYRLTAQSSS
jgi:hypothetical protein